MRFSQENFYLDYTDMKKEIDMEQIRENQKEKQRREKKKRDKMRKEYRRRNDRKRKVDNKAKRQKDVKIGGTEKQTQTERA